MLRSSIVFCLGLVACAPKFPWPEFRLNTTAKADQHIGVSALMLEATDTLTFDVESDVVTAELLRYRRTKIFNEAGVASGAIKLPFSAKMKLYEFDAQMRCPEGNVERITKARHDEIVIRRPFAEEGVREYGEVSLPMSKAAPGCVIEHFARYHIPDAMLLEPIMMRDRLPIERAEVLIITPKGADFELRYLEGGKSKEEAPMPATPPSKSQLAYRFVQTGLSPLIAEEYGPSPVRTGPAVWPVYRSMKNGKGPKLERWDDVFTWIRKNSRVVAGGGTNSEGDKLLQAFASEAMTIEVKESGLRFGERKFATGNDRIMAGLKLYDALAGRGFKVGLGLVARESSGLILPEVPSPAIFDAVVVAAPIGGKIVYMDPACPSCPLDQVSQALEGAPVVAILEDGSRVESLPVRDPKDNAYSITLSTKLGLKGDVVGSGQAVLAGAPAAMVRAAFVKKDMQATAKELGFTNGLQLTNMQAPDGAEAAATFDVSFDVATSCAEEGPARMRCALPSFVEKLLPEIWREARTMDLLTPQVFQHQLVVTYQIPSKARVQPPQPMTVKSKFGEYTLHFQYEPGQLAMTRRFSVLARRIPADEYDEFYAFLAQARRFDAVGPLVEFFAEEPPPPEPAPAPEPEPKKGKKKKGK
ncbi:MAG: hypothetical protein IT381_33360 [Deltaproteobacteria bacterium]|nr:hypothetical protein [Deltaproteobacteria bacterium]